MCITLPKNYQSNGPLLLRTCSGTPPTVTLSGTLCVTTAPAAIHTLLPTVTGPTTVDPILKYKLSPQLGALFIVPPPQGLYLYEWLHFSQSFLELLLNPNGKFSYPHQPN